MEIVDNGVVKPVVTGIGDVNRYLPEILVFGCDSSEGHGNPRAVQQSTTEHNALEFCCFGEID